MIVLLKAQAALHGESEAIGLAACTFHNTDIDMIYDQQFKMLWNNLQ